MLRRDDFSPTLAAAARSQNSAASPSAKAFTDDKLRPLKLVNDGHGALDSRLFGEVAGEPGFEPRLAESESAVLPLNYSPNGSACYGQFLTHRNRDAAGFRSAAVSYSAPAAASTPNWNHPQGEKRRGDDGPLRSRMTGRSSCESAANGGLGRILSDGRPHCRSRPLRRETKRGGRFRASLWMVRRIADFKALQADQAFAIATPAAQDVLFRDSSVGRAGDC